MVAVHEIGHGLGLDHNNVQGSIMNPYYTGYIPNFKLSNYDVQLIQALYGSPGRGQQPVGTTTTTTRAAAKTTTISISRSSTRFYTQSSTLTTTTNDIPVKLYCLTSKKPILLGLN